MIPFSDEIEKIKEQIVSRYNIEQSIKFDLDEK